MSVPRRMGVSLRICFRAPGIGANPGICTWASFLGSLTTGFFVFKSGFPPAYEQLVHASIHKMLWIDEAMDTKSRESKRARQASFDYLFLDADSGTCKGFLLKF